MKTWKLVNNNTLDPASFKWASKVFKDKVIVIADDHCSTLTWLKYSLEDYGARVFVFEHGKDAIDFLQESRQLKQPVDALILDIIMNEIGGLEIARLNPDFQDQTIFLTGCSWTSQEVVKAQKLGKVLQKPIGLEDIVKNIMTTLSPEWEDGWQDFLAKSNEAV